jgi:hypothetical protein
MGYRFLRSLLLCAVFATAFAMQPGFPHRIGKPGVQIRYLSETDLPESTKAAITELVFWNLNTRDCIAHGSSVQEEIDVIRVAQASLNGRSADLLVQASDRCNCGGTGNCSFWVLRLRQNGLESLLATDMVQQFSVEKTRSHCYRDLMTATHGSATLQDLVLYRFDGKQYHASQCARVEYHRREDDSVSDKPTITSEECGTE